MDTEAKVEWLAKVLCLMVGIEPTDPLDGSANWFIFANDAEKIIKDIEGRGFSINAKRLRTSGEHLQEGNGDGQ